MTNKELTRRVKQLQQSLHRLNDAYCYTKGGKLRDSATNEVSGAICRAEKELGELWFSLVR